MRKLNIEKMADLEGGDTIVGCALELMQLDPNYSFGTAFIMCSFAW